MEKLWAITCYFNPMRYGRRLENYRLFRRRLAAPLATVELAFDGDFELGPGDADILVQLRGGDVMWQKERLLNVCLKQLPEACDKIAWLDCDIVFGNNDWAERAMRSLEDFPIVQLFGERHDLPSQAKIADLSDYNDSPTSRSAVLRFAGGEATLEELLLIGAPPGSTVGLAWAGRREVFERHGFYDACILGSGDRAMLCAAFGRFDFGIGALHMNPRRSKHYLAWARPYFETVRGRVGHLSGPIFHLWHGELEERRYQRRHRCLAMFDFDPFTDLRIDPSGVWRWSSDKKELHAFVRGYFASRNEDGPRPAPVRGPFEYMAERR